MSVYHNNVVSSFPFEGIKWSWQSSMHVHGLTCLQAQLEDVLFEVIASSAAIVNFLRLDGMPEQGPSFGWQS